MIRITMLKRISAIALLLLFISGFAVAQTTNEIVGTPLTGAKGVTLTAAEILKNAELVVRQQGVKIREELHSGRHPIANPNAPAISSFPKTSGDAVINQQNTQTIHSNYAATHAYETPSIVVTPPDCMGDVGPTQVCIASNNRIKWYAKPTVCDAAVTTSTTSGALAASGAAFSVYIEDFFASVIGPTANVAVTDPHVHYDRLSQRWFIVAINTESTSNRIMIAVSSGPTITAQSNFTFYYFNHDQGAGAGSTDQGHFCDYPTLGVDQNALYIGGLIFNGSTSSYIGSSVYVVRKSSLTSGGPIVFTPFRNIGTNSTGIFCPQGVDNDEPGASTGYFLGVDAAVFSELNYLVVSNPGGTPSILSNSFAVPAATAYPIHVPASGSTKSLDGGDDRILNAMLVKNKITGESMIWATQNIGVLSTGSASASATRTAVRWYALSVNGSTMATNQSGTLYDNSTGASPLSYWMGSIAASGQGHAVVGATVAGATVGANAAVAGRYSSTTPGLLFAPVNATNYADVYNLQTDETQRWGDYSQTVVDPSDDMTIWTFQEFVSGGDRWAVRAIQLKAPPPATVSNMTFVCNGDGTANVTLTGTSTNFSGFFDPGADAGGPGFFKRLAVSSTGSIAATSLVFVSPTQLTFKLNFATATPGSSQTLTVTNPDCQTVTYVYTVPTGCGVVPLNWVSVNAHWDNGKGIVVWKVANEVNVKGYEIERSADGKTFVNIGSVASKNAASAVYSFAHLNPEDDNYYRIKQTDIDGKISYSSVVALFKKAITKMGLYPNPARGLVRVLLTSGTGSVRMLNAAGQVVYSSVVTSNTHEINTAKMARGVYMIEFVGENGLPEKEKLVLH